MTARVPCGVSTGEDPLEADANRILSSVIVELRKDLGILAGVRTREASSTPRHCPQAFPHGHYSVTPATASLEQAC